MNPLFSLLTNVTQADSIANSGLSEADKVSLLKALIRELPADMLVASLVAEKNIIEKYINNLILEREKIDGTIEGKPRAKNPGTNKAKPTAHRGRMGARKDSGRSKTS